MKVLYIGSHSVLSVKDITTLRDKGFEFTIVDESDEGVAFAREYAFDVVLIEHVLKDTTAVGAIKLLRGYGVKVPVIVLTNAYDSYTAGTILNIGADDFVRTPLDTYELSARMGAVVRRSHGIAHPKIELGPVHIDLTSRQVTVHGSLIKITPIEYKLLKLLALRKGNIVSRSAILDSLYVDELPDIKYVDILVSKLRTRLRKVLGKTKLIHTKFGEGYVLCDPEMSDELYEDAAE